MKELPLKIVAIACLHFLTNTSIINQALPRQLLGDDQLEDRLRNVVSDIELSPKLAQERVATMLGQVNKVKDKCSKYFFIIKNYIAFFEERRRASLAKPKGEESVKLGGLRRSLAIDSPSSWDSFGDIESHELGFRNLDQGGPQ